MITLARARVEDPKYRTTKGNTSLARLGQYAGVDTSGFNINSGAYQWAMKKIHLLEDAAKKGDWNTFDKLKYTKGGKSKPNKSQKTLMQAQAHLEKIKEGSLKSLPDKAVPSKTDPAVATDAGWKKVGGKLGTEKGGTYTGPDGEKYYVKQPDNAARAHNEVLAFKLYELAGGNVVKSNLIEIDGKPAVATKWDDDLKMSKWAGR